MTKIVSWIRKLFHKPKRLNVCFVTYSHAEKLLKQGWTLAKEEDTNTIIGFVYLELLDKEKP